MLSIIYWVLAILTMLVLLSFNIYLFVKRIKDDKEFEAYKRKQEQLLEAQVRKFEKERNVEFEKDRNA